MRRTFVQRLWPVPLVAALLVLTVGSAQAAPGGLDPSFGTGGKVVTNFGAGDNGGLDVALQSDGKIVAGGWTYNGTNYDFALIRSNANGSLDTSFGNGGKATTAVGTGNDFVTGLALQPDGKIVAAGRATLGGKTVFGLARVNANGSLDTSFGTAGKVTTAFGSKSDPANGLVLQPDGKIVVGGTSFRATFGSDFALARYNPNGSLDPSFGLGGKVRTSFGASFNIGGRPAIQPDGKILLPGTVDTPTGQVIGLARYNPNGSLDPSFGTGGKVTTGISNTAYAYRVAIQPDGKIVAGGYARIGYGSNYDFALVRYKPNGLLDTSFGTGGRVTSPVGPAYDAANALALQPNGKIVLAGTSKAGSTHPYVFALARYKPNGSLDTGFGVGGTLTTAIRSHDDEASAVQIQADGKLVVGGFSDQTTNYSHYAFALARYLGDSHALKAARRGSGKGTVASTPSGIACGSACAAQFADASSVTLTATPRPGSIFSGWGGDCSGKKESCALTMSAERSVTAKFSMCVVPKLKGKPLRKAKRLIRRNHCSAGRVKRRFSRTVKKGRVSAQKPKPGAKRRAGAKVNLVVSKGRP